MGRHQRAPVCAYRRDHRSVAKNDRRAVVLARAASMDTAEWRPCEDDSDPKRVWLMEWRAPPQRWRHSVSVQPIGGNRSMQITVLGIDLGKGNTCSIVGLDVGGAVVLRRRTRREGVHQACGKTEALCCSNRGVLRGTSSWPRFCEDRATRCG